MATARMLPAVEHCRISTIAAIASRDLEKAQAAARQFAIPQAFGSYEALLADPGVDAVYIPLPNHLHAPWAIRAAEAGKHVLIEKPAAITAHEVREMIRARDRAGVLMSEAFMVRTHPRWIRAVELIRSGRLGQLRAISGYFTIPLADHTNVRYEPGGGALLDLGCYQVTLARWLFGEEPVNVRSILDRAPSGVDRLSSFLLEFASGHASFTCAFESVWAQRLSLLGTHARMDVELPTSAPEQWTSRLAIDDGSDPFARNAEIEEFRPCNQYAVHLDAVSEAIERGLPAPVPLEDSLATLQALDAMLS